MKLLPVPSSHPTIYIYIYVYIYKIIKIVLPLWLAERRVCMRVCKHGCDIKMFCFSRANHASTNLKKALSWKPRQFYFIHFIQKHAVSIFFRLSWHFKREKTRILEGICFAKQGLITRTSFVYKTSRLVRICLLISALNKRVLPFFSGKLFYKSNRKLFSCVCTSWYKHSRGWENSRQLRKSSTNPSRVYIRLCKHAKSFLLLKYNLHVLFCQEKVSRFSMLPITL